MIVRAHFLALLLLPIALADDSFSCAFSIGADKYDLKPLEGEKLVSRTRETPPTSWVDELRFNVCAELKQKDGVADQDQCPAKTRACLTKTNKKKTESDRIIAAIPLATSSDIPPDHKATITPLGVSIIFHGPAYPPSAGGQPQVLQSLNITLLCATENSEPKLLDYDGGMGTVEWKTTAGCVTGGDKDPGHGGGGGDDEHHDDDNDNEDHDKGGGGGGMGWFFFLFILAFAAYFGLGAYHNYNQYGATGWDLVPHRDFWREVPYMFRDLVVHIYSSFRQTPTRGGYHSV